MAAISSALIGAAASLGGAAIAAKAAKKNAPKEENTPDPGIERANAEAQAAQASNSALAAKNRARKASSLLARDDQMMLANQGGKSLLGQ